METTTLYVCALILTVVVYLWSRVNWFTQKPGKPLPGPGLIEGLSVLIKGGINNTLHLYLPVWAERYGKMMQVNLLLTKVVFINTADTYRRLVKSPELRELTNDRPPSHFVSHFIPQSIAAKHFNDVFHERRRLFHNVLKFYGESKEQVETAVISGLTDLSTVLDTSETIEISVELGTFVAKLIIFLMTGDIADARTENVNIFKTYCDGADGLFLLDKETLLQPFPWLRFILGLRLKKLHENMARGQEAMHKFYFYTLKERFDSGHTNGIAFGLFDFQKASLKDGSKFVDDDTIKGLLHDLIFGSYATTSATLSCLFLHLVKYPELQDRIYQEIQEVVGASTPSFSHKSKMPYTEAALLETLRISTILPFLAPHVTRKDIVFDGYIIPQSTVLFMNSWSHHHNEELWDDPFAFKPDRFLDTNGQLLSLDHPTRQQLMPFGTGPRMCPGESFAKSLVFLITIYLLKHFEFVHDVDGPSLPSSDPREYTGLLIRSPAKFSCKARRRENKM